MIPRSELREVYRAWRHRGRSPQSRARWLSTLAVAVREHLARRARAALAKSARPPVPPQPQGGP